MEQNFAWLEIFQQHTWSYELGLSKPDAAIYAHTIEKLRVTADQALFIDDLVENVRGAEAAGLHAVVFTTPAQLQTDLDRLGFAAQLPPVISKR
jgi:FMN phosphatase YigB (HAD superfamily)